jgi:hypothetical protein
MILLPLYCLAALLHTIAAGTLKDRHPPKPPPKETQALRVGTWNLRGWNAFLEFPEIQ